MNGFSKLNADAAYLNARSFIVRQAIWTNSHSTGTHRVSQVDFPIFHWCARVRVSECLWYKTISNVKWACTNCTTNNDARRVCCDHFCGNHTWTKWYYCRCTLFRIGLFHIPAPHTWLVARRWFFAKTAPVRRESHRTDPGRPPRRASDTRCTRWPDAAFWSVLRTDINTNKTA